MFLVFTVLFSGVALGRLLAGRRLGFLPRLITGIIWVLLFLLGAEVGLNPEVVGGMATLGLSALIVCSFGLVGSIFASWLLWRRIRDRITPGVADDGEPAGNLSASTCRASDSTPPCACVPAVSTWTALRGSLVIVVFFVAGCVAGVGGFVGFDVAASGVSAYTLYVLMFCVGMTLGHDTTLVGQIRRLDWRLSLLPLMTAVGTLAGAVVAAWFARLSVADSLAVGAGFGYYSLSSIFIADLRGVELGAVALLCNVMRELFTLVAAPLVARWFGPLAAISIGGATTFDTTLPIITRAAGRPYAVVSVFHGCAMDLSVPFLVTLFCTL